MASNLLGKFVLYKPTRKAFAVSSGSWTGNPANKVRPCLVVGLSLAGNPVLAPCLGARYQSPAKAWGRVAMLMIHEHWGPLKLKNRSAVTVPHNPKTGTGTMLIETNDDTSVQTPIMSFKPCFVWTADEGEEIMPQNQANLVVHTALGHVDKAVLQQMRVVMAQMKASSKAAKPASSVTLQPLQN
ncbi:hypothetical protein OE88DRAFT_1732076 [Heliocybe sulcata]|uniref:Uncharacterized protein n=1 Tax=Heliocybe sulcata TaxID=5364 RepID=A0A5C3NBP9_9AGAM|nr:hypothetical protein OE88DRAFT_1732076 [Heliocybe sulcata]